MNKIIVLIIFLGWLSIFAETGEWKNCANEKEVLASISEKSLSTNTIESNFIQKKKLKLLSETITSKGKFYFKKKDKMRWEYLTPFKHKIVMNGTKITIEDDGKKNSVDAGSSQLFLEINKMMSAALQGLLASSSDFSLKFYESSDFWMAEMTPKSKQLSKIIKSIEIVFDKKNKDVAKLIMKEVSGDESEIIFIEKSINKLVPDSLF